MSKLWFLNTHVTYTLPVMESQSLVTEANFYHSRSNSQKPQVWSRKMQMYVSSSLSRDISLICSTGSVFTHGLIAC